MQCPCSGDGGVNPLLLLAVFVGAWLLFNWVKTLIKSKGVSFMNKATKMVIVIALVVIVGIVIAIKQQGKNSASAPVVAANSDTVTAAEKAAGNSKDSPETENLPQLVDLGAGKCIPCKMMAPMLEELKAEYKGRLEVAVIDVWKKPDEAKKYGIKIIPTQIFYDASGKELFRHEGFFSKEDIFRKWKEFGVNLEKGTNNETN